MARSFSLGLIGPLPPPNGGMAMQTEQLARLMRQEGLAVEIVQTNAPYRPRWVERIRIVRAGFRLLPYLVQVWRLAGRSDVIHLMANSGWSWQLFSAPVLLIGRLRGTPVIVNYRGGEARAYLEHSIQRVRPVLASSAAVVVPSGFLQEVFREFDIATQVIPNIVDTDLFAPATGADSAGAFTVVVTRNLEQLYGIDTAIRAAAMARQEIPGIRMKIAGSGPQRESLLALVEELGLSEHVEFVGRLDRQEVAALYQSADVALNPARADNMPNSVLEALASGLPVVSTRVGGVPYLVQDGETALLVPVDDVRAMAQALVNLYYDADLRTQLGDNGRQYASQFAWDKVRARWLDLYQSRVAAA